jgi:N-acetylglutamate synthase-like GNAT family acetyltransferase
VSEAVVHLAKPDVFYVRKAVPGDTEAIWELLQPWVKEKILLSRTREEILSEIDRTFVCVTRNNEIAGTVSIIFFQKLLCEVRALAVKKEFHNHGIGLRLVKGLVKHLVSEIKERPLRIFALTYTPEFFAKAGFTVTKKENFPDKIYEVCAFCARKDDCHEIAVEMVLGDT